jgi:glycosyltransferase involved in cell wall biosynthesis
VIWLSDIGDAQLAWLYRHCELFVVTSDAEGFCLPLMEALSFACRAVCTDIPVLREVSQGRCTLFDRNNDAVGNLVAAMIRALALKPAADECDQRFSRQAVTHECLQLYSQLLARNSDV